MSSYIYEPITRNKKTMHIKDGKRISKRLKPQRIDI